MTEMTNGSGRPNRLKVIEANLLGGATVGQIAAVLNEPAEATAATILEMAEGWRREWGVLRATGAEVDVRRLDLAINALWGAKGVQSGDTEAITQLLKLMALRDELLSKIATDPFPAGEKVPGQVVSRTAYGQLLAMGDRLPWWQDYLDILAQLQRKKSDKEAAEAAGQKTQEVVDRADWRVAAYIAWASSPVIGRWPETEQELANRVLGLKSARTIRKWKVKHPWIEKEVAYWQASPLMAHRRDAFEVLVEGATTKQDPRYFQYTKLYLEMTKDYVPKGTLDVRANTAVMELPVPDLSDEELDAILENLLIAEEHQRGDGREVDGQGEDSPTSEESSGSEADPGEEGND